MTEILETPSPFAIRDELHELVLKDLLGPAGGDEEELDEPSVRERYLVGMLAPRKISTEPNQQDDLAVAGAGAEEDGQPEPGALQTDSLIPSSFGLTFAVDTTASALQVSVGWGRYQRVASETAFNDKGAPLRIWRRSQISATLPEIPLTEGDITPLVVDERFPDVVVRGRIRKQTGQLTDWMVTLFLVNGQVETKKLKDEQWLFQPQLSVASPDGSAIIVRRYLKRDPLRLDPLTRSEIETMSMLYRHKQEFAVGHGVSVTATVSPDDDTRAVRVGTVSVPVCEVPRQTPPTAEEIPALAGLTLDMKELAETPAAELSGKLNALPEAYAEWIAAEESKVAIDPTLEEFQVEANDAVRDCRKACDRIRDGIALLQSDPQAAEAFLFANRAMWLQRIHSIYTEQIRRGVSVTLAEIDITRNRSWYPFQLAFVLLNLPGITVLNHKERSETISATADLLWFPTGGGKTEAYLGLTAYTLAIRRLQGEVGGLDGMHGVAVLMRYTLRVLTLQQFQRATTLICACEAVRRERSAAGDGALGEEPFRIGIWVGQRTTPNTTDQSDEAVRLDRGQYQRASQAAGSGTPAQLKTCPWCGKGIKPSRDIKVETVANGRGRTFTFCSDPLGQCLFSRKQSPDEGIPMLLVDEEVYRRLPALLIATVDKFAQMPWNGQVQMLFGRVDSYCPRHGFRSAETEDSDLHPKRGAFPAVKSVPHGRLRPPDLIIQDELHLISGPLGTLVGLYETAVDKLASFELDGMTVRPKVIASTATIRRARQQVFQLFLRETSVFPPHGTDVRDNFFSVQRDPGEKFPGRRYLGISAMGKRLKTAIIRVYAAYLSAAQTLYNKYGVGADPWMTLAGYFNSMRELGGTRRLVDDRIRSMLRSMDTRGLAPRSKSFVRELTSRVTATDIPDILDQLEVVHSPENERKRKTAKKTGRYAAIEYPIDVLLATNMISVGVDVKRLGLMVVNGQPKTTAEYIQATSRVGRSAPGLVCTVYNWSRPRDLSHYERFEHYHSTFYQQVEALSLTPFAARARERGLAALLVSLIRLDSATYNANTAAADVSAQDERVVEAIETIVKRVEEIEGATEARQVRARLKSLLDSWRAQTYRPDGGQALGYKMARDGVTPGLLRQAGLGVREEFTCLMSLREVEPSASLILVDSEASTDASAESDGGRTNG